VLKGAESEVDSILLTISQALQLVALAPCLFVIAFLLCTARKGGGNILPILYFISLSCSFIIPLLGIFGMSGEDKQFYGTLLLGESLNASLSFLLIMQFLMGRVPPVPYWMILALPVLGGSPFIYASLYAADVCFDATNCYSTAWVRTLYQIFSVALIFLLLIYKISMANTRIAHDDAERLHKYWLIISLVGTSLLLSVIDLLMLAERISKSDQLLASTFIRISFIYLVLTSIFRVFYDLFDIQLPQAQIPRQPTLPAKTVDIDKTLVERLTQIMEEEHLYREMGLTRKMVADRLGLSEQQTSRIVNAYFRKNFSELVNSYRIREAKERLIQEDVAVTVIAFEVGFNSIASFNRVFKEHAGVSPSDYRSFHKNVVR
jgi:AraC-like DNA-binding protein